MNTASHQLVRAAITNNSALVAELFAVKMAERVGQLYEASLPVVQQQIVENKVDYDEVLVEMFGGGKPSPLTPRQNARMISRKVQQKRGELKGGAAIYRGLLSSTAGTAAGTLLAGGALGMAGLPALALALPVGVAVSAITGKIADKGLGMIPGSRTPLLPRTDYLTQTRELLKAREEALEGLRRKEREKIVGENEPLFRGIEKPKNLPDDIDLPNFERKEFPKGGDKGKSLAQIAAGSGAEPSDFKNPFGVSGSPRLTALFQDVRGIVSSLRKPKETSGKTRSEKNINDDSDSPTQTRQVNESYTAAEPAFFSSPPAIPQKYMADDELLPPSPKGRKKHKRRLRHRGKHSRATGLDGSVPMTAFDPNRITDPQGFSPGMTALK